MKFKDFFKTCRECLKVKALDEFYVHPEMADGHLNKCKVCVCERMRRYRFNNPDRTAAIDKAKYEKKKNSPEFRVHQRDYLRNHRTPEELKAHYFAQYYLRPNKPNQCSLCNDRPAEDAHHPDYKKPEEVLWLCTRCHLRLHHSREIPCPR